MTRNVNDDQATKNVADDTNDETDTADEELDVISDAETGDAEQPDAAEDPMPSEPAKTGVAWSRVVAFILLPGLAVVLAGGAGYVKWRDGSIRNSDDVAVTSVQVARDSTIALLSYTPATVEQQLGAARDLLTGDFRDSYTSLTTSVVIPGAKDKQISASASVPAAAVVSATPKEAVVLVFVNQTVTMGPDAPTSTASSVRVTLDKVGDRWLISQFDPV